MNKDSLIKELKELETKDRVRSHVMQNVRSIIREIDTTKELSTQQIFLTDFSKASPDLRKSIFFTDAGKAILAPQAIVINQDFILEMEAALRSFNMSGSIFSCQYLKSDGDLFSLIERISNNPMQYLNRLRKLEVMQIQEEGAGDVVDELTMITFFFVSHEIGHLISKNDMRNYSSFLKADATLEHKITNAVVKLCRHTDEFKRYGFSLPGWEQATKRESAVRQMEESLRKEIEALDINHAQWFKDEETADNLAIDIILNYFASISQKDAHRADLHQYLMIKALFVVAVYTWYKDLHTFCEKLGIRLANSQQLTFKMMQNRDQYIRAASLFGEVHRFTLLRAMMAIDAILAAWRKGYMPGGAEKKWFKWNPADLFVHLSYNKNPKERWLGESHIRYALLAIIMDTAIKIAYVGCSTAWIKRTDETRGTEQLLLMNFESIDQAVERFHKMKEKLEKEKKND